MPSLGKIEEFNPASTSINRYLEQLEQYFKANSVPADSGDSHKGRAILISVIGAKAYHVLSDLCSLTAPLAKTYTQLSTILKNHFALHKLVIAERCRFHNCIQHEGESISTFVTSLKHLASTCWFGAHLNKALRDRPVCCLRNNERQKKLLTEEHTFGALKVALSTEAAEKDVAAFSQDGATPINKVDSGNRCDAHPPKRRKPPGKAKGKSLPPGHKNNNSTSECLSCRKMGHARSRCKYRN